MTQVMPQDELLRKAIEWIMSEQLDKTEKSIHELIDEAGMRHNLSPSQCARLQHLLIAMNKK